MKQFKSIWQDPDYGMTVPRSPWYRTLFRLQDCFVKTSMRFFSERNLSYIPLPVTTGSISSPMGLGSDSLPVQVELGGESVYLADSMQFLLEYACRMCDVGAFYLMPSFRGEATDARHLSQFFHAEAEIPGTIGDVIALVEHYIAELSQSLLQQYADDVLSVAGSVAHLEAVASGKPIPRIRFAEALRLLEDCPETLSNLPGGFVTVSSCGEAELMRRFGGSVWLTDFDANVVPFYQASEGGYAKNADLLMGIGETVGAGQRHRNAGEVLAALAAHRVAPESYGWYVRMKELYPMQTSGFGMGMERFLLWVLKHNDIRDCQIISRLDGSGMAP